MGDIVFDGGTDDDRAQVLRRLHDYLDVNATFDWAALAKIWSHDPTNVFFNMNGHTYVGLEHWTRLWQYYHDRVHTGLWQPYDVKVLIRGEMAVVTCHRRTQNRWKGPESERPEGYVDRSFVSRATMVMVKEDGDWRTVHVHFSPASTGPRHGNV